MGLGESADHSESPMRKCTPPRARRYMREQTKNTPPVTVLSDHRAHHQLGDATGDSAEEAAQAG